MVKGGLQGSALAGDLSVLERGADALAWPAEAAAVSIAGGSGGAGAGAAAGISVTESEACAAPARPDRSLVATARGAPRGPLPRGSLAHTGAGAGNAARAPPNVTR